MFKRIAMVLAIVFCASCTSAALPPTPDMRPATREAELKSTQAAIEATQTALAFVPTPAPAPTDCGAAGWWNYAGGSTLDFMDALQRAGTAIRTPPTPGSVVDHYTIIAAHGDILERIANDVSRHDYPLCMKSGRDRLIDAMTAYVNFVMHTAFSKSEVALISGEHTSESLASELATARERMANAAAQIADLTGADTSMLLNDGVEP